MSGVAARKHPFHIIDPSPWPATGALAAFTLAVGAVHYMHDDATWLMLLGVFLVLTTMVGWWRDVIHESVHDGAHTSMVRKGLRMGMAMFIASEVMFFVAFFWAFFDSALLVNPVIKGVWPPEGIEPLHAWGLPAINTLILITSGFVLMWAKKGMMAGRRGQLIFGLFVTVALGFTFLTLQAIEYGEATFGLSDGIYPSVFYLATGFHGFHVFVGACFLTVMLFRALKGNFGAERHTGFEAAEWYWHFVDVVWIFLFVWVYWWVGA
jgi:heme/copper-type cytochrome/quinol oxidase subunit 3